MEINNTDDAVLKRAVSYNRVSTEEEKQLNALEKQIQENREVIERMGWRLTDEYIDEGKSGTQTKKRGDYLRLFQDLESGRFDIVVIKDQDRLMRNPKDWYLFIDKLLVNHKQLYIHLDNSFYNPDNALITGIKAILAEEYSRHLSRKINNAHQNRQRKGESLIITNRTYGYKNTNGVISIDESEREIVELIFRMYANGKGARLICKELTDRGYRNRSGKAISENVIREIVRNPLYKGTAVMNKRHLDFNTKKVMNMPKEKWIYHEEKVEPIVSAGLWQVANRSIDQNSVRSGGRKTGKKTGQNILSGKVVCGECGGSFWRNRRRKQEKDHEGYTAYWYCSEYYRYGKKGGQQRNGCNSLRLKEEEIYRLLEAVGEKWMPPEERWSLLEHILDRIELILMETDRSGSIEYLKKEETELAAKKKRLMDLLVDGMISKSDYAERLETVEVSLSRLREKKQLAVKGTKEKRAVRDRIEGIRRKIEEKEIPGITAPWAASHLEQIKVYEKRVEIYLDFLDSREPLLVKVRENGRKRELVCQFLQEG